jgi:hypothetical protein
MPDTKEKQDNAVQELKEVDEAKVTKPSVDNPAWAERSQWEANLRVQLRTEYEQLFSLWKLGELEDLKKNNDKTINENLQKIHQDYLDGLKPPTHEEIEKLLNQEYEEFNIPIRLSDGSKTKAFVIRELPQESEIKFFKIVKDRIIKRAQDLGAFYQESIDVPFETKAKAFMSLFDESFDLIAEAVTICLNPFDEDKEVTRQWVQHNIGSDRQWRIVEAQMKVSRLKDFFSKVSQSGQQIPTMMGSAQSSLR